MLEQRRLRNVAHHVADPLVDKQLVRVALVDRDDLLDRALGAGGIGQPSARAQGADQQLPEETGTAGDDDFHGVMSVNWAAPRAVPQCVETAILAEAQQRAEALPGRA